MDLVVRIGCIVGFGFGTENKNTTLLRDAVDTYFYEIIDGNVTIPFPSLHDLIVCLYKMADTPPLVTRF